MLLQVLSGHRPGGPLRENDTHTLENHFWIGATENVAATVYCLRSFRNVSDSDVGHTENAALFLNGTTVAENAKGVFFEADEIEKAKWFAEPDLFACAEDRVTSHPVSGARVQTAYDWHLVLLLKHVQGTGQGTKPILDVDVFFSMHSDKKIILSLET